MFQLIDELISKLDAIEDAFLIGLLEAKKVQLEDLKINIDVESVRQLTWWAASEVRKVIPFSYQKEIDKIQKLHNTVFNCEICPLAKMCPIRNEMSYDEDNKVCDRCGERNWTLVKYEKHLHKMHEKILDEIVANESIVEIIKMKSIIRNINRKLKKQ